MTDDAPNPEAEDLPPFKVEKARSGRSKCKGCKRPIQKDKVRIGIMIEGPFGPGYLWHHLSCAMRRRPEDVEQAYADQVWEEGLEVPSLESLRAEAEKLESKKSEKKEAPYVEVAPTGRSKCKHCAEPIEKGAFRVAVLRNVEFYGQTRSGPINVHPACVVKELEADDCATEAEGFADLVRENSKGLDAAQIDEALRQIGTLE